MYKHKTHHDCKSDQNYEMTIRIKRTRDGVTLETESTRDASHSLQYIDAIAAIIASHSEELPAGECLEKTDDDHITCTAMFLVAHMLTSMSVARNGRPSMDEIHAMPYPSRGIAGSILLMAKRAGMGDLI